MNVEIVLDKKRKRLWINIDEVCRLRVSDWDVFIGGNFEEIIRDGS